MQDSTRPIFAGSALLLVAVLAAYAGVVDHDFVGYDDGVYVSDNARVRAGLEASGIRWAFTTGHAANWHPLTWLSHMLDVELFGLDPGAMASTNVVIHGAVSVLLLIFLARATGAFWPALLAALAFAIHPLRVESVAWIAERKDVLSGLFFLTTCLAWWHFVRRPSVLAYGGVLVSLACGLMAKPVLVTLPCVLLLLDVWPLGRWRFGGSQNEKLSRLLLEKLPLAVLALASSVITLRVQAAGGAMRPETLSPLDHRVANALSSYVAYLGKTLWPVDLVCFYPLPTSVAGGSPWTPSVLGASLLLIVATALAVAQRSRRPWLLVGWLWYLGTLVPMIGLVQVGNQAMADRYTYVPGMGLALIAAGALGELAPKHQRAVSLVLAAVLLAICLPVTRRQVEVWSDGETLFEHAIAHSEGNALAHYNLGTRLLRGSPPRPERARPHLEEAVRLDPGHPRARLNLGALHWLAGRAETATPLFEQAVALDPFDADARLSLGTARFEQGRVAAAIEQFEVALELEPDNPAAHANLGTIYLSQGRVVEARRAFERALELDPDMQQARAGLREAASR